MFENLRRDSRRYADNGGWLTHPGFWIVAVYRFGVWARALPAPLWIPPWVLYRVLRLALRIPFNVEVWAGRTGARIGPGLCLIHPWNVLIARGVEIGEDCLLFHEVTLGRGPIPGSPRLGNRVDVYVGARVLGGVEVGDGSMVGPNCVVTRDVPAESVVLSAPPRVIPRAMAEGAKPSARGADPLRVVAPEARSESNEAV